MSGDQAEVGVRAPWHLWVVGVVTVLWNAMGAFDYIMTETRNEGYMSHFTAEQLEHFYGVPAWFVAFWALAVWGAVLGSILLLLRKKLAVTVFLVSFLSMIVTMIYSYGLSNGLEVMGGAGQLIFSAVIFLVALLLYLYARAMRSKGVLV